MKPGWESIVDDLVRRNGSLAATAELLASDRHHQENVESIERALRRLRTATGSGGIWGRRVLQRFGLPDAMRIRLRWIGSYHSRFTDLPVPAAHDLLRHWDRPALRESSDIAFLDLGAAILALRRQRPDDAHLALARVSAHHAQLDLLAQVEYGLITSFLVSRTDPAASQQLLTDVEPTLLALPNDDDRACLAARWVDQRAYALNRPRSGPGRPHEALALYQALPDDGPAFARCRRHNGLGWSHRALNDHPAALHHARASVQAAGDAGFLRLRAMALTLLAAVSEGNEANEARRRATDIATGLHDALLLERFRR